MDAHQVPEVNGVRGTAAGPIPGSDGESPTWPNMWLHMRIMPTARRIGIANVNFQIMRRSFSTDNITRDHKSTQAIMGHAKLDMTR